MVEREKIFKAKKLAFILYCIDLIIFIVTGFLLSQIYDGDTYLIQIIFSTLIFAVIWGLVMFMFSFGVPNLSYKRFALMYIVTVTIVVLQHLVFLREISKILVALIIITPIIMLLGRLIIMRNYRMGEQHK